MPPAWPSRLLSGPTTPNAESSIPGHAPRQSPGAVNGHGSARTHAHTRSSSHPLPRVFSKKPGQTGWGRHEEQDEAVDPALVPVLDAPPTRSPARNGSGRKRPENDNHSSRPCMCCAQRVRFPTDIKVFRCTHCLTINDLVPFIPQSTSLEKQQGDDTAVDNGEPGFQRQRTRAIIDHCLLTYLESKFAETLDEPRPADTSYFEQTRPLPPQADAPCPKPTFVTTRRASEDKPEVIVDSTAITPDEGPSASIRSFADFDHLNFSSQVKLSSSPLSDSARSPITSNRVPRKPLPPSANRRSPANLTPSHDGRQTNSRRVTNQRTQGPPTPEIRVAPERYEKAKSIFKPLEDYVQQNYGRHGSLNASFSTYRPRVTGRTHSESALRTPPPERMDGQPPPSRPPVDDEVFQIDAKTLLLGDFAENGDWWTGRLERNVSERVDRTLDRTREGNTTIRKIVTLKSPCIDWSKLDRWYEEIRTPNYSWPTKLERLRPPDHGSPTVPTELIDRMRADIELDLSIARDHTERVLFKVTEHILRRPGRPLSDPDDIRFLIVILSNPLLYPRHIQEKRSLATRGRSIGGRRPSTSSKQSKDPGQHAGILKRALGLLAGSSESCHRHLVAWFSRMPEGRFVDLIELVASFVSYRLARRRIRPKNADPLDEGGLIPDLSGSAMRTSAQLQTAAGLSGGVKGNEKDEPGQVDYTEDWQLRSAARVMALLFAANNNWSKADSSEVSTDDVKDLRPRSRLHGQLLPISDFYNTLLDYQDVIADFRTWELKKGHFSFCQYPFFLSMGAKIKILEYDAKRQMETKARETYFNNVISGRAQDVNFHLHVRRDCVVEDSLTRIGEAVGKLQGDLKKGLRVHFTGEEGIDAGGLKKEWFLLLIRDIFDPNHGLFLYDQDSRLCYFNPHSFETSDQYYLVGILLGLAIYNSIILDVALPSFAFRKLLACSPGSKVPYSPTLDDLAEYRPSLAQGLRTLLEFPGDVQETYCWSFVVPAERYGVVSEQPLIPGGESKPVTNSNRHEFVTLYVRHLLDASVARQFEPFKRGFFTITASNALSLFQAEEIELLIRGAEEDRIDVDSLRAVATYENFRDPDRPDQVFKTNVEEQVPVVKWFWDYFREADPRDQRKLLQFITASDRVPATGAAGLVLRVAMGGDGTGKEGEERYPVARTCFNLIVLWGWKSKEQLIERVRGAVEGSEGFGLK